MNWDAIGAVAELLSAIGVLATLIYLSIQIRRNSSDVRNSTLFAVMSRFADNRRAHGTAVGELTGRLEAGEELTAEEKHKLRYFYQSSMQDFEAAYHQYLAGSISKEVMSALDERLRMTMKTSTQDWNVQKRFFTKSFANHFDELINGGK